MGFRSSRGSIRPGQTAVSIPKRGFGGFSPIHGAACLLMDGPFQSLRGVLVGFRGRGYFDQCGCAGFNP